VRGVRAAYGAGTTVLVTGGAGGIGSALGAELSRRGATVVLADLDGAAAEAAARRIGSGARGVALDVRDGDAFAALVAEVDGAHGGLDVLVNNAGVGVAGPVEDLSAEHWRRALDVNLGGVVHGVAAAYPRMRARGAGQIVNMASLAGLVPLPLLVPYATTKHAVVGLSTSLRAEAAGSGVRVNVICPTAVRTGMLDRAVPEDLPEPGGEEAVRPGRYLTSEGLPAATTPEALAADAVEGMARDRAVIVLPRAARRLWLASRLAPGAFLRITARNGRVERQRTSEGAPAERAPQRCSTLSPRSRRRVSSTNRAVLPISP
jgi:NAD(P)-dependent dehydrogenase (short-subunit alcohol dehydrogenase family)